MPRLSVGQQQKLQQQSVVQGAQASAAIPLATPEAPIKVGSAASPFPNIPVETDQRPTLWGRR